MKALSEVMKDLLVAANVGVEADQSGSVWGIFRGVEPDMPDNCITLYDTPGDAPNPLLRLDNPRVQVRVRSFDYDEAYAKGEEIKSKLLGLPSQTIDGIIYVGIWIVIDNSFVLTDDKGRALFTTTYRAIREVNYGDHRINL